MNEQFANEVDSGLSSEPKTLPSKYFYDARGDDLFVQIMNMPEYYLTDCEMQVFSERTEELAALLKHPGAFDLVELGAGDGTKTIHLLRYLSEHTNVRYCPIDISQHAVDTLAEMLSKELPALNVYPVQGDYFKALDKLGVSEKPQSLLFLGSNLGNMIDLRAHKFIETLSNRMKSGDKLLLGLDLRKDPSIILPAYNDKAGITREFNLNLLRRINRELDGAFDIDTFDHEPVYDAVKGEARSYLVSKVKQQVYIGATDTSYVFDEGERIHTETSRKYDPDEMKNMAAEYNLEYVDMLQDERCYFADMVFQKK
jgi:dimethylhistidine N-methyltransferase